MEKFDVPKTRSEKIMNKKYMNFLFNEPTAEDCNEILAEFKKDVRKIKKNNPIYKGTT